MYKAFVSIAAAALLVLVACGKNEEARPERLIKSERPELPGAVDAPPQAVVPATPVPVGVLTPPPAPAASAAAQAAAMAIAAEAAANARTAAQGGKP